MFSKAVFRVYYALFLIAGQFHPYNVLVQNIIFVASKNHLAPLQLSDTFSACLRCRKFIPSETASVCLQGIMYLVRSVGAVTVFCFPVITRVLTTDISFSVYLSVTRFFETCRVCGLSNSYTI